MKDDKSTSLKQMIKDAVKSLAKDLAWQELSKEERKQYMEQAKEKQKKKMTALAIKCVSEADKAMSKPGYVSRADSSVYLDIVKVHKEPKDGKKKDRAV